MGSAVESQPKTQVRSLDSQLFFSKIVKIYDGEIAKNISVTSDGKISTAFN